MTTHESQTVIARGAENLISCRERGLLGGSRITGGVYFRAQKYSNILSTQGEDSWKIWTAAATRDQVSSAPSIFATSLIPDNFTQDTSRAFVAGFNQSMVNATLVIVDEGESQFANTLTPHVSIPLVFMTWD